MKKHVSDPAPRFIELGVTISPELEAAVLHTLQKEKDKRTPTVEALVQELREAIYPQAIGIHTTSGRGALPVSTLSVHTRPPQSRVYVDNVAVGQSRDDGWLLLEGVQSGNHHLRVTHDGFQDWSGDVVCDGNPRQIVAELRSQAATQRDIATVPDIPPAMRSQRAFVDTNNPANELQKTVLHTGDTGADVGSKPVKRGLLRPIILGIVGLILLLAFGAAGLSGAYMLGWIPKLPGWANTNTNTSTSPTPGPTSTGTPTVPGTDSSEMVNIPGGTFTMGRNGGNENERPEHAVTVKNFSMDKHEVTNAEYLEFVQATSYRPFPVHWVNEKPIPGQERMPVRFVSGDDVRAFAAWRSKRDGVEYRLPTEEEWEYAARNGSKADLYPWGDKYNPQCAVLDRSNNDPEVVGSKSCPNSWGVQDLIGNVFEWTSSEPTLYPGSSGEVRPLSEPHRMLRGGAAIYKSTGTERDHRDIPCAGAGKYPPRGDRISSRAFELSTGRQWRSFRMKEFFSNVILFLIFALVFSSFTACSSSVQSGNSQVAETGKSESGNSANSGSEKEKVSIPADRYGRRGVGDQESRRHDIQGRG